MVDLMIILYSKFVKSKKLEMLKKEKRKKKSKKKRIENIILLERLRYMK